MALVSGQVLGRRVSRSGRSVRVEVEGLRELTRQVFAFGEEARAALARALYEEAEELRAYSEPFVPVESGNLRDSGYVVPPVVDRFRVEVAVGYGGFAAGYALPVHEIPPPPQKSPGGRSARHEPPHGRGGQWKFLEEPFLQRQPGVLDRLVQRLRDDGVFWSGREF